MLMVLMLALCFICLVKTLAGTTILMGSLTPITTTVTNSPSLTNGTMSGFRGTFTITTSGLGTNTQALFFEQISLDGTNFITVNTFKLTNTNDTEIFIGGQFQVPVQTRILVSNTVPFSAGGSYTQ